MGYSTRMSRFKDGSRRDSSRESECVGTAIQSHDQFKVRPFPDQSKMDHSRLHPVFEFGKLAKLVQSRLILRSGLGPS